MKQKKLTLNFFVYRNRKKLTDNRKKAKILADNRKIRKPRGVTDLFIFTSPFSLAVEISVFTFHFSIFHALTSLTPAFDECVSYAFLIVKLLLVYPLETVLICKI